MPGHPRDRPTKAGPLGKAGFRRLSQWGGILYLPQMSSPILPLAA
jgi:hypothetical protein